MEKEKSKQKIPEKISKQIEEVAAYAGNCDDWVVIKKEVMKNVPSSFRKLFSRRDPITKEQSPNSFDMLVIEYYFKLTGIQLKIRTLEERRKLKG